MIAVADYGVGNLGSVIKAFRRAGAETLLTADPEHLARAEALVLPGDGAFGATMDEIRARGLEEPLRRAAREGRPLLGICVGMQVLFEESEEHGRHRGLGLLPGKVRRFSGDQPVPHMGWNRLWPNAPHWLLEGVAEGAHVYFVHSYHASVERSLVVAECDYGGRFPAVVGRGSVLGLQFHPEKSQGVGLALVRNYVRHVLSARREAPVPAGGTA